MTKEIDPFRVDLEKAVGTKMTGAEGVVKMMAAYDVEYAFGYPGITFPIFTALGHQDDVKLIHTRDERSAAFMADGYARASYKPGIVVASEGPGATNLPTGMAEAFMSSVPVIFITGARSTMEDARNPLMFTRGGVYDTFDMLKPFTKWSVRLEHPSRVVDIFEKAFRVAVTGRQGPVQVQMSVEAINDSWELNPEGITEFTTYPAFRVAPDPEKVAIAVEELLKSKRPLVVAGGGIHISQAWPELQELVEKLHAPVVTTLYGKASISEDYELYAGTIGIHARKGANETFSEADLVVFIGSNTDMHSTNKWAFPKRGTRIIHVDIDPDEIGRNFQTAVGVVGDAKLSLKSIITGLSNRNIEIPEPDYEWLEVIKQRTKEWHELVAEQRSSSDTPIKPQRVIKEINEFLGPDDIVVADLSFSSAWATVHYIAHSAGRKVITGRGFTPVGWGFPAAIGVTLGAPGRKVLGIVGDGSFAYGLGELETISRYNVPAVTIVMNNSILGYEKFIVKYFTKPGQEQTKFAGMDFSETNYANVASSFGCLGIRVEEPEEIRPALENAFGSGRPTIIDIKIDPNIPPPVEYFPKKVRSY